MIQPVLFLMLNMTCPHQLYPPNFSISSVPWISKKQLFTQLFLPETNTSRTLSALIPSQTMFKDYEFHFLGILRHLFLSNLFPTIFSCLPYCRTPVFLLYFLCPVPLHRCRGNWSSTTKRLIIYMECRREKNLK